MIELVGFDVYMINGFVGLIGFKRFRAYGVQDGRFVEIIVPHN